jgi:hypothetical protein
VAIFLTLLYNKTTAFRSYFYSTGNFFGIPYVLSLRLKQYDPIPVIPVGVILLDGTVLF